MMPTPSSACQREQASASASSGNGNILLAKPSQGRDGRLSEETE
jgi:hypothetical protein